MKFLKVTLTKSRIGAKKNQQETLRAMKLTTMHKVRIFTDTPNIRGMINRVTHLVSVEEVEK